MISGCMGTSKVVEDMAELTSELLTENSVNKPGLSVSRLPIFSDYLCRQSLKGLAHQDFGNYSFAGLYL
jgi:hypothetical protein